MPPRDAAPPLLSIDWGTSSLRAYLLDAEGGVLDEREGALGIMAVEGGRFAEALRSVCAPWIARHGPLPAILSGMIGSRQGWVEAPYLDCPVDLGALGQHLTPIAVAGLGPVRLAPGVAFRAAGGVPDVMRGEECQILGALTLLDRRDARFLMPGTHSKLVEVRDGRIRSFATYMTGEVYAALSGHTILGRLMAPGTGDGAGFARGVDAAAGLDTAGGLLHAIFSARTLRLFDEIAPEEASDYLSGLLIGAELCALRGAAEEIVLIGSPDLVARYRRAAARLAIPTGAAPAACVRAGHLALARQAGLLNPS